MESQKRRLRGLITRECVSKGINLSNTNFGCSHAESLLEQGRTVSSSVRSGIAVAEGQQRKTNYRLRSTVSYIV